MDKISLNSTAKQIMIVLQILCFAAIFSVSACGPIFNAELVPNTAENSKNPPFFLDQFLHKSQF